MGTQTNSAVFLRVGHIIVSPTPLVLPHCRGDLSQGVNLRCQFIFPSIPQFFRAEGSYKVGGWPANDERFGWIYIAGLADSVYTFS